jgi:hypothetical protein
MYIIILPNASSMQHLQGNISRILTLSMSHYTEHAPGYNTAQRATTQNMYQDMNTSGEPPHRTHTPTMEDGMAFEASHSLPPAVLPSSPFHSIATSPNHLSLAKVTTTNMGVKRTGGEHKEWTIDFVTYIAVSLSLADGGQELQPMQCPPLKSLLQSEHNVATVSLSIFTMPRKPHRMLPTAAHSAF